MARPTQITLAAAIILLAGGLAVVAAAFLSAIPTRDRAVSLMVFAIGGWGLVTGAGLLRLQSWARQSVLVCAGLLAYLGVIFAPLVISFRIPADSGVPQVTEGERILTVAVCLLSSMVGLWCARAVATKSATELFGVPPARVSFSIAVIGWYLVMSGTTGALGLLRIRQPPTMTFGFVLIGWHALVVLLFYSAVNLSLGIGLLRRQEESRRIAIYYGFFQLLNGAAFLLRPDREAGVKTYYDARILYDSALAAQFSVNGLSLFLRFWNIESCIFALTAVWFLRVRRSEFADVPQPRQMSLTH